MANYNIVVDTSNFKPYTFQDLIAPYLMYKLEYEAMEDKLLKYADEYGQLTAPGSKKLLGVIDSYNTDLAKWSDDFAGGMTQQNASALRLLFARSRKELAPIKAAKEEYNKYVDKWDTIYANDDSAIRGYNYTLDDFYGGNLPDLGYKSGKRIESDAVGYFTGLSNALAKDPIFKDILNGLYFLMITTPGITSSDAISAALSLYDKVTGGQKSEAVNDLVLHMLKLFNSEGVDGFTDSAKRLVWNRISSGLMKSILTPQYQQMQNQNFESTAARQKRLFDESMAEAESKRANDANARANAALPYQLQEYRDAHKLAQASLSGTRLDNEGKRIANEAARKAAETTPSLSSTALVKVKSADGKKIINSKGTVCQISDGSCYYTPDGKKYYPVDIDSSDSVKLKNGGLPLTLAQVNSKDIAYTKLKLAEAKAKAKTDEKMSLRDEKGFLKDSNMYTELGKTFLPINYRRGLFKSGLEKMSNDDGYFYNHFYGSNDKYNLKEYSELGEEELARANLALTEALKLNPKLTMNDLDIYIDSDWASDDHYRVVIHGTSERGNFQNTAVQKGGGTVNNNAGLPTPKR